ncbi:MAG: glycosyltransferase family 2 protein, partial [Armatimonadetes bacterium]|nr:glycosyltransferase family 2 protein [Armatimonadota bacterium]
LSVVMPAYNEEATLEEIVSRVLASPVDLELVLVNDASTDRTGEIAQRLAAADNRLKLITHEDNQGKGAAVRTGLAAATGDVVLIQDADLEYDPADYPALLKPLERDDADAVFGSRYLGPHACQPLYYYLGNKLITWWFNLLYGTSLSDVLTCYKVFRRRLVSAEELKSSGFSFDVELPARLVRARARIFEVPIYYGARGLHEGKKIRWWHAFSILWAILRFRVAR